VPAWVEHHIGVEFPEIDPVAHIDARRKLDAGSVLRHIDDPAIYDAGRIWKEQFAAQINAMARNRAAIVHMPAPVAIGPQRPSCHACQRI
jgi:hypothetical protein